MSPAYCYSLSGDGPPPTLWPGVAFSSRSSTDESVTSCRLNTSMRSGRTWTLHPRVTEMWAIGNRVHVSPRLRRGADRVRVVVETGRHPHTASTPVGVLRGP